jgi:hypothetical protein
MPFRNTIKETFKLLGFAGPSDLLASALGLKLYSWPALKFYLVGSVLAGAAAFCTRWIWEPPSALVLLVALDALNARYGYLVAKKLKQQGFKWDEFQRTFGKMLSTVLVLAIVRNAINAYPYYDWLADLIFGWLFITKTQKVASKMVALKVQEEGLPNLLQGAIKWLLNTKLAPFLVDTIQHHSPAPPADADTPPDSPLPLP